MSNSDKISVIIPTHRRFESLLSGLRSLQDQGLQDFEIVVVENDVDVRLSEKLRDFNETARRKVTYIHEPRLGLHYARHAGALAAAGDILVFTDDDATFHPDWLAAYYRAFTSHPEMAAAGGPVFPEWEATPPKWLLDYIGKPKMFGALSFMDLSDEFRLDDRGIFFGVNMAIRRQPLIEVGGFNPEAFGSFWLGDGETGLNKKLQERGMLIGYVPEALVFHHIPAARMTVGYLKARARNQGCSNAYTRYHKGIPGVSSLSLRLLQLLRHLPIWLAAPILAGRTDPLSVNYLRRASSTRAEFLYTFRLLHDRELRQLVLTTDWLER